MFRSLLLVLNLFFLLLLFFFSEICVFTVTFFSIHFRNVMFIRFIYIYIFFLFFVFFSFFVFRFPSSGEKRKERATVER